MIGTAGSADKVDYITNELGFDVGTQLLCVCVCVCVCVCWLLLLFLFLFLFLFVLLFVSGRLAVVACD